MYFVYRKSVVVYFYINVNGVGYFFVYGFEKVKYFLDENRGGNLSGGVG